MRYAWFSQARRLAMEVNGQIIVYDTLDHQIGGVFASLEKLATRQARDIVRDQEYAAKRRSC